MPVLSLAMKWLVLVLAACGSTSAVKSPEDRGPVASDAITVSVAPETVYIEETEGAQLVNCDLYVRNASKATFELAELEVSVRDRSGALVMRKFVDGNGVSPSVTTVPNRTLGPQSELLLLNPLHTFPRDLDIASLEFALTYEREGAEDTIVKTVTTSPRPYEGTPLALPVRERMLVWDGHDFLAHHRRWDYRFPPLVELGFKTNPGRYSYDFVVVDQLGTMLPADASEAANEQWFGFGSPVYAPAAGTVVAIEVSKPDDRKFDEANLKSDLMLIYGNYIAIEHRRGEVSLLAHLKQTSAQVKLGDRVTAGQEIAAIGASGSANFPHLHYQLQTDATANAEGLPSYFENFVRVRGATQIPVAKGAIETGEIVSGSP